MVGLRRGLLRVFTVGEGLDRPAHPGAASLMEQRRIAALCERGTGEDSGTYRATFYYEDRLTRLVVDREGQVVGSGELRSGMALPP